METLERRLRSYFTTARVIHNDHNPEADWLWVNSSSNWHFDTEDEAQSLANQANANAIENSGLDIENYPYFVIKVTETSRIEKVE